MEFETLQSNEKTENKELEKYIKLLNFLIENLDKDDRYILFKKYKNEIRKLFSKALLTHLKKRRTHLSNDAILKMIYINPEIFDFILKVLFKKMTKLNYAIIILSKNKDKIKDIAYLSFNKNKSENENVENSVN